MGFCFRAAVVGRRRTAGMMNFEEEKVLRLP
jgi:hypothetical protein